MNTESNTLPESAVIDRRYSSDKTRPLFWSVRRELWENRSIYIAPLIVAGVVLFGYLISSFHLPERRRALLLLDPAQQRAHVEQPYDIVAMMILMTAFVVGIFYCLDALHGERRDRSILFWKSLPVSDFTTVLSKVLIPMAVLPGLVFVIIASVQFIMFLMSSVILLANGLNPGVTWTHLHFFQSSLVLLYSLVALALWHAPLYGWLLLVSGWARRATFLWAVLPFAAISVLEKIALGTTHFGALIGNRLIGFAPAAFGFNSQDHMHSKTVAIESLSQLTPGRFLSDPGLWFGLIVAAAFLAAAIRLRRYRGPI